MTIISKALQSKRHCFRVIVAKCMPALNSGQKYTKISYPQNLNYNLAFKRPPSKTKFPKTGKIKTRILKNDPDPGPARPLQSIKTGEHSFPKKVETNCYAMDAFTNATNNGCGFSTVLFSSG